MLCEKLQGLNVWVSCEIHITRVLRGRGLAWQYVHGKWTNVCIQNIMVSSAAGNNT